MILTKTNIGHLLAAIGLLCVLASPARAQDGSERLLNECQNGFVGIKTVKEMRWLIEELTRYRSNHDNVTVSSEMKRCVDEFDVIVDLKDVFDAAGSDICHPNHISKLLEYKYNRLKKKSSLPDLKKKRQYLVRHFFRRYAMHVSLFCRRNMLANLREATNQEGVKNEVFYELINEFNPNVSDNKGTSNRSYYTEIMKLLKSIQSIGQLAAMMPIGSSSSTVAPDQLILNEKQRNLLNSKEIVDINDPMLQKIIPSCDKYATYFESAIVSVVRLDNAGYRWKNIGGQNERDEDKKLISDWFKITASCFFLRTIRDAQSSVKPSKQLSEYHKFNNKLEENQELCTSSNFFANNAVSKADRNSMKTLDWLIKMKKNGLSLLMCRIQNKEIMVELMAIRDSLDSHSSDKSVQSPTCGSSSIFKVIRAYLLIVVIAAGMTIFFTWLAVGQSFG